jgi:hypothetical protein
MSPALLSTLPLLAWAIFAAAAALTVLLGLLLAYHWLRYAMNPAISLLAMIVYGGVAFVLLSALLASTIANAAL